jgi:ElaB/YqjD/DUF883 family membrane-anchored ribosome-binding protein
LFHSRYDLSEGWEQLWAAAYRPPREEATFASAAEREAAGMCSRGEGQDIWRPVNFVRENNMPPRDPSLPEGTDKIIDTNAIDTGGGAASGGGNTPGPKGGASSKASSGTSSAATSGNTTATTGGDASSDASGGSAFTFEKSGTVSKTADTIVNQLKDQVSSVRSTATDRARTMADDGKRQATDFLQTLAEIIQDAASSVEEKLGSQYSGYGSRAADGVNSLASKLNERSVDDLVDDARDFVRRSPAAAIGIAAVVGFAVARVVRAGIEDARGASTGGTDQGTTGTGTNNSGRSGA